SWGSQRETDRQRAQARKGQVKQREDGLTPEQRRERDAKALQEKAAKKAAQAAAGGGTTDSKNKGSAKKIGQCVQSVSAEKKDTAEFQSSAGIGVCTASSPFPFVCITTCSASMDARMPPKHNTCHGRRL
ncbi:unnamed protein product, partial [Musa hybrid cultivar]